MISENRIEAKMIAGTGTTLADQALDIIWQLVEDRRLDAQVRRSLLERLAEHPKDPARALLEHMMGMRAAEFANIKGAA